MLVIAIVASMGIAFLVVYHQAQPVPYVTNTGLQMAQIGVGFVIALAGLGLAYKSIRLSRSLLHIKNTIRELQDMSEIRETFIHMAQHRLRTPLSGVRWALGSLRSSTGLSEKELELVEKSREKMDMAEELLSKMLKLHNSDLSDFELSNKENQIDLADMITEIINDLDYLAKEKSVTVNFDPTVRAVVAGEKYILKSALTNVVDNSIRYSPEGEVTISIQSASEGVKLIISDTGIGMTKVDQKRIFERFYRGQNARAVDPNQSGIGMYLTNQVIGMHGGKIEVESEETEGTTFTITLPQE